MILSPPVSTRTVMSVILTENQRFESPFAFNISTLFEWAETQNLQLNVES